MNADEVFRQEVEENIERLRRDDDIRRYSHEWMSASIHNRYTYNFSWLGRPIIQYPQDIVAMQEILWTVRPNLVIETGVARGGSLVFYASMLELIGAGSVLGIDIDIRAHNREALEQHPMMHRIELVEGSSISPDVVASVSARAQSADRVVVVLDSNHTHDHVLAELRAYAPLVSLGSYCVVMDTLVEEFPEHEYGDRPWGVGDNPRTAVAEFLKGNAGFEVDERMDAKLQISSAAQGYLRRIA